MGIIVPYLVKLGKRPGLIITKKGRRMGKYGEKSLEKRILR